LTDESWTAAFSRPLSADLPALFTFLLARPTLCLEKTKGRPTLCSHYKASRETQENEEKIQTGHARTRCCGTRFTVTTSYVPSPLKATIGSRASRRAQGESTPQPFITTALYLLNTTRRNFPDGSRGSRASCKKGRERDAEAYCIHGLPQGGTRSFLLQLTILVCLCFFLMFLELFLPG
jgi:hypothetical protein